MGVCEKRVGSCVVWGKKNGAQGGNGWIPLQMRTHVMGDFFPVVSVYTIPGRSTRVRSGTSAEYTVT